MLILHGELRSTRKVKTKGGSEIEILNILTSIGKTESMIQVANFSKQIIKAGKVALKVAPKSAMSNGRAFLNWATFEGQVS